MFVGVGSAICLVLYGRFVLHGDWFTLILTGATGGAVGGFFFWRGLIHLYGEASTSETRERARVETRARFNRPLVYALGIFQAASAILLLTVDMDGAVRFGLLTIMLISAGVTLRLIRPGP